MKIKALTSIAVLAIFLGLLSSATRAQMIPVTNFSFESPAGTLTFATTDSLHSGSLPGFTFVNTTFSGVVQASVQFAGPEAGGSYGGVGVTGSQIGFLNIDTPAAATITSNSVTTIIAGTNYVATVAVGNDPIDLNGSGVDLGFDNPGTVFLNLLANSAANRGVFTVVSTSTEEIDTSTIPEASFENFTISLSAAQATALAGDSLEIQMEGLDPSASASNNFQPVFDDVRLEASVAPEPATWAFLAGGLLFLAAIRRYRLIA